MPNVFQLLDEEWVRLRHDRRAARQLSPIRQLANRSSDLAGIETYVRSATPAEADAVLAALAARATTHGDRLAARALLQLLLPGTRNLARRWWALGDLDERSAAAVTAVYHRIRTYPIDRRPERIAANILLDAAQELRRTVPRSPTIPTADLTSITARTTLPTRGPEPHPAVELTEALLDAAETGTITAADAELIAQTRIGGRRVADLAQCRGLRPRTLWDRRHRAEVALAEAGPPWL